MAGPNGGARTSGCPRPVGRRAQEGGTITPPLPAGNTGSPSHACRIPDQVLPAEQTLNNALFVGSVAATGLMLVPTVLDVLMRLMTERSLPGTVELVEFLMAILVFGALGFLNDRQGHIRVDLLYQRLPHTAKLALDLLTPLCAFLFFFLTTWSLALNALNKIQMGETTLMLGLNLGWLQLFGVLGLTGLCLSLLAQSIAALARLSRLRQYGPLFWGLLLSLALILLPFLLQPFFADGRHFLLLGAGGMGLLMLLLFLGMPIGMVMAGVGCMGMLVIYNDTGATRVMLGMMPYASTANYLYSVIPMFILMGELALCAGISQDLFQAASLWLGRFPGGLAMATVAGCAGFAAVSGDSMATAVTMTAVALPEMERHKYDSGLACATLAAGGTLGILIPPSTGFIFYSLVTEESVGKLFLAGILPGIALTLLFMALLWLFARRHPELAPPADPAPLSIRIKALRGIFPMLTLAGLIIGGILRGWFSPNEGGAIGAAVTALYALIRGRLTWNKFHEALRATALVTARLLLILMGVGLLSSFLAATALPTSLAEALVRLDAPRMIIFTCIVLFYILLGCVMNVVPMILLTLPALFPAVLALGFDPVWFGVVVVIMMEMGQITPPVGLNVYALAAAARHVPMPDIFRRILPFFLAMLTLVLLLALFPGLATWLPRMLY